MKLKNHDMLLTDFVFAANLSMNEINRRLPLSGKDEDGIAFRYDRQKRMLTLYYLYSKRRYQLSVEHHPSMGANLLRVTLCSIPSKSFLNALDQDDFIMGLLPVEPIFYR